MPVNDFEKQVQQKMDELQFAPSDAVWHEVEKQITPRKRRRLFIWLPLLVLLLGGAALLYNTGKKDTAISVAATSGAADDHTAIDNKNATPQSAGQPNNQIAKQPVATKEDARAKQSTQRQQQVEPTTSVSNNHDVSAKRSSNLNNNKTPGKTAVAFQKNTTVRNQNTRPVIANADKNINLPHSLVAGKVPGQADKNKSSTYREAIGKQTTAASTKPSSNQQVTAADSLDNNDADVADNNNNTSGMSVTADQLTVQKTVIADSSKKLLQSDSNKSAVASKPANKNKRKLEWGIHVQGGSSNISEGVTSLFKSAPAYDVNSAYFSNQPSSPISAPGNGSSNGIPSAPPSAVRRALSYSIGAFISKPVASQLKLMMGLNYHYYSTSIRVGAPVVSASFAMDQYRTGNNSSYTNKFHFIELPVTLQKQFGKSSRFSIDGGVSLAWLAGSKALLYDVQQSQYVTNKSYINKTQVSLLAAFNYRLFHKSLPVEIGPRFSYGFTNMFTKEIYGSTHLFFTGIQARIYFSKK